MAEQVSQAEAGELRTKIDDLKHDLGEVTKLLKTQVVDSSKKWAHEHPAAAVGVLAGVAAGIGLVLGLLIGRSRD